MKKMNLKKRIEELEAKAKITTMQIRSTQEWLEALERKRQKTTLTRRRYLKAEINAMERELHNSLILLQHLKHGTEL